MAEEHHEFPRVVGGDPVAFALGLQPVVIPRAQHATDDGGLQGDKVVGRVERELHAGRFERLAHIGHLGAPGWVNIDGGFPLAVVVTHPEDVDRKSPPSSAAFLFGASGAPGEAATPTNTANRRPPQADLHLDAPPRHPPPSTYQG